MSEDTKRTFLPGCYRNLASEPDESLPGYLLRLSEGNGYSGLGQFLKVAGLSRTSAVERGLVRTLRTEKRALETLGRIAVGDPAALLDYFSKDMAPAEAIFFRNCLVDDDAILDLPSQWCPHCLQDDGYFRSAWELACVTVCEDHLCRLNDTCSECGSVTSWTRSSLLHCHECGSDFRFMPAQEAAPEHARVSSDFSALAPFRIDTFRERGTTEQWDSMYRLFKALTLPASAWIACEWPKRFLRGAKVDTRHQATASIARVLHSNTYRLSDLAKPVASYLAPLNALRRPQLVERYAIQYAMAEGSLRRGLAETLCADGMVLSEPKGVELYEGKPPVIRTHVDAAEFLGANSATIDALFRKKLIFKPTADDFGIDIDHLLEAQKFLTTGLFSLSELSQLTGVSIDWDDIGFSRLVHPWNKTNPTDVRFEVDELFGLQLRLAGHMTGSDTPPGSSSLGNLSAHVPRPGSFVLHSVALALRGDLEFAWKNPYRWADILVSEKTGKLLIKDFQHIVLADR